MKLLQIKFEFSGGVSKNGRILELYRDENSTQNFHQISCKEKGKRCGRFRSNKLFNYECVQKYSFTYALVREFNAPEVSHKCCHRFAKHFRQLIENNIENFDFFLKHFPFERVFQNMLLLF